MNYTCRLAFEDLSGLYGVQMQHDIPHEIAWKMNIMLPSIIYSSSRCSSRSCVRVVPYRLCFRLSLFLSFFSWSGRWAYALCATETTRGSYCPPELLPCRWSSSPWWSPGRYGVPFLFRGPRGLCVWYFVVAESRQHAAVVKTASALRCCTGNNTCRCEAKPEREGFWWLPRRSGRECGWSLRCDRDADSRRGRGWQTGGCRRLLREPRWVLVWPLVKC